MIVCLRLAISVRNAAMNTLLLWVRLSTISFSNYFFVSSKLNLSLFSQGLCDTCVSDNCPLPSSSPTSPNLPRNCCLFLDEKDYVTQSCFSADFECEDFPVPGWIFLHQFILYEDECRHLCHPPSPSPTPSPPTALTPPTPTPTPTKLLSNCCVFATPDFTVKQCLSFHDPCPSLPNWELLLESLRYEEECQELCFPPTPSPTPTPTPTPTSNFESPLRLMFVGITPNEGQSKVTWSYYITSGSVSDPEATNDLFYVELAICKFYTDESQVWLTFSNFFIFRIISFKKDQTFFFNFIFRFHF